MRLLISEDNPFDRSVLTALLVKEGYDVVVTASGEEAVTRFTDTSPDLVLMDVRMPGIGGMEATRRIKAIAAATERVIPVLFLTGMQDEQCLAACLEAGGDDFLTKPYSKVILKARIDALLRQARLHRALRVQRDELASHRERLLHERELAVALFDSLVVRERDDEPNLTYRLEAAEEVNGDLVLSERDSRGTLRVLVGDFTGHGLVAAVGALPAAELFRTMGRRGDDSEAIVAAINRRLRELLPPNMFLAAAVIELSPDGTALRIWNGGLPDLLLRRRDKRVEHICSAHLPLGVAVPSEFDGTFVELEVEGGDRLVAASDGVSEACNPHGGAFGEAAIESFIAGAGPTESLVDRIYQALNRFRAEAPQRDDITIVELTCAPADAVTEAAEALESPDGQLCGAEDARNDSLGTGSRAGPVFEAIVGGHAGEATHGE